MNARLDELLTRMVAVGPFPQISASEGHEVVDGVGEMDEALTELLTVARRFVELRPKIYNGPREFYQAMLELDEPMRKAIERVENLNL